MAELSIDKRKPRTPRKNPTPRKRSLEYEGAVIDSSPEGDGSQLSWEKAPKPVLPALGELQSVRESPRKRRKLVKPDGVEGVLGSPASESACDGTLSEQSQKSTTGQNTGSSRLEAATVGNKSRKKKRSKLAKEIAKYEKKIAKLNQSRTQECTQTEIKQCEDTESKSDVKDIPDLSEGSRTLNYSSQPVGEENTQVSVNSDISDPSSNLQGKGRILSCPTSVVNKVLSDIRVSISQSKKVHSDMSKPEATINETSKCKKKGRKKRLKKTKDTIVIKETSPDVITSNAYTSTSGAQEMPSMPLDLTWKSPGAPLKTPKRPPSVCTTRILSKSVEKAKRRMRFSPDKPAPTFVRQNLSRSLGRPSAKTGMFQTGNDVDNKGDWSEEGVMPLQLENEYDDQDCEPVPGKEHSPTHGGDGPVNQSTSVRKSRRLATKREKVKNAKAKPKVNAKQKGKNMLDLDALSNNEKLISASVTAMPGTRKAPKVKAKRKAVSPKSSDEKLKPKRRRRGRQTQPEPEPIDSPTTSKTLEKSFTATPIKDDGSLAKGVTLHLSDNESIAPENVPVEEIGMLLLSLGQKSPSPTKDYPILATPVITPKKTPMKTPMRVNHHLRTPSKTPSLNTSSTTPARFVGKFSDSVQSSRLSFQDDDNSTDLPLPPRPGRITTKPTVVSKASVIEVLDTHTNLDTSTMRPPPDVPHEGVKKKKSPVITITPSVTKKTTRSSLRKAKPLASKGVKVAQTFVQKFRTTAKGTNESTIIEQLTEVVPSTSTGMATPSTSKATTGEEAADSPGNRQLMIDNGSNQDEWEDEELDQVLDEKASSQEIPLTATNVKAIIKAIITNDDVLDMVRNTLVEEEGLEDELKEAIFEPRITRAKIKNAVEKGKLPPTIWPLTPVKGAPPTPKPKTFTDLEFPEDEEDDDYNPIFDESDVDSESVVSSHTSDFGSPRSQLSKTPTPSKSGLQARAIFNNADSQSATNESEPPLALRLRSKMPLTDTTLEKIEASLVAPDVTPDLYNSIEATNLTPGDRDWQTFLAQIHTTNSEMNDTYDEKNDPEFNVLEEVEQDEDVNEEKRNDKAVKISRKEMESLLEELFEAYEDSMMNDVDEMPDLDCFNDFRAKPNNRSTNKLPYKPRGARIGGDGSVSSLLVVDSLRDLEKVTSSMATSSASGNGKSESDEETPTVPEFTQDEALQLQDQMRKHVQLLAQTFVLSNSGEQYQECGLQAAKYIDELKKLGNVHVVHKKAGSFFHAINLTAAHNLVTGGLPIPADTELLQANTFKRLQKKGWKRSLGQGQQNKYALTWPQMDFFCRSTIFLFPQMLPETRFYDRIKKPQFSIFSEAEDNLLALGLKQFEKAGKRNKCYKLIKEYMMPTKTIEQLMLRVKRQRSAAAPDNILKQLRATKELPEFEQYLELEDIDSICPPEDRDPDIMPSWFKFYELVKADYLSGKIHAVDIDSSRCSTPDSLDDTASDMTDDRDTRRASLKVPGQKRKCASRTLEKKIGAHGHKLAAVPAIQPVTPSLPSGASTNTPQTLNQYIILSNPNTPVQAISTTSSTTTQSNPVIIMSTAELAKYGAQLIDTSASCSSTNGGQAIFPAVQPVTSASSAVSEAQAAFNNPQDRPSIVNVEVITMPEEEENQISPVSEVIIEGDKSNLLQSSSESATTQADGMQPGTIGSEQMPTISTSPSVTTTEQANIEHAEQPSQQAVPTPVVDPELVPTQPVETVTSTIASCGQVNVEQSVITLPCTIINHSLQDQAPPATDPQTLKTQINENDEDQDITLTDENQREDNVQVTHPAPSKHVTFESPIRQTEEEIEDLDTPVVMITEIDGIRPAESPEPNPGVEPSSPSEKNSELDTTPLKGKIQVEDSPSKLLSPANLLLAGGDKMDTTDLEPCDLQLTPDNHSFNDSVNNSFEDTDTSGVYIMNTPVKFVPNEENSNSPSVYSDRSDRYSNSPGFSDHSTPPKCLDTPTKSAVEIMAAYAQFKITPRKPHTPHKPSGLVLVSTPSPKRHFTPSKLFQSPPNKKLHNTSPLRLRPIVPKPGTISPPRVLSPIPKKSQKSPRRKILQQKARAILPKGFIPSAFSLSPTKKAAANLTRRARTRGGGVRSRGGTRSAGGIRMLLPKSEVRRLDLDSCSEEKTADENDDTDIDVLERDFASGYDTLDSEFASEDNQSAEEKENDAKALTSPKPEVAPAPKTRRQRRYKKKKEKRQVVEGNDSGSEDDGFGFGLRLGADSQDEADDEDPLAQFMAASTTIRFDPKSRAVIDSQKNPSKAKAKRELTLHMLAPDLVVADVLRDERDTALAQAYLTRVKEAFKDDKDKLEAFFKLLYDFSQSDKSPVELHREVGKLLADHPAVLADFSGFLLPDQAQECGCFVTNFEFGRARSFLRKIETFFGKHSSHLQKILKAFANWDSSGHDVKELRDQVLPLLRGQQHLMDHFKSLFSTDKPANDHTDDFEEVHIKDEDDSSGIPTPETSMEEVSLPEARDDQNYGTARCKCQCHHAPGIDDKQAPNRKPRIHCNSCSMKVMHGKLHMQTVERSYKPVRIQFIGSQPQGLPDFEAQKEDLVSSDEDTMNEPLHEGGSDAKSKKPKVVRKKLIKKKLKVKLPGLKPHEASTITTAITADIPVTPGVTRMEYAEPLSPINISQDSTHTPQNLKLVSEIEKTMPTDFSILRSEIGSSTKQIAGVEQLDSPPKIRSSFSDHAYGQNALKTVTAGAVTSGVSPFKIIVETTMTGATLSHSTPRMRIASKDIQMCQQSKDQEDEESSGSNSIPSQGSNSNSNSQTTSHNSSSGTVPDANSNPSNLDGKDETLVSTEKSTSAHQHSPRVPVEDESANFVGPCSDTVKGASKPTDGMVLTMNLNSEDINHSSQIVRENSSSKSSTKSSSDQSVERSESLKSDSKSQDGDASSQVLSSRSAPSPFIHDDATMGFSTLKEAEDSKRPNSPAHTAQDNNGENILSDSSNVTPSESGVEQPAFRDLLKQTAMQQPEAATLEKPDKWSISDDREIMHKLCTDEGPTSEALTWLSQALPSRPSVEQVEQRYNTLVQIYRAGQTRDSSSEDDENENIDNEHSAI